jgi:hypothetical protein
VATAALRRKKASEAELDRLAGTRLQLETQVNTLESANLNAETMAALKKGSDALKVIHGNLYEFIFFLSFLAKGLTWLFVKDDGQGGRDNVCGSGAKTAGGRNCRCHLKPDVRRSNFG